MSMNTDVKTAGKIKADSLTDFPVLPKKDPGYREKFTGAYTVLEQTKDITTAKSSAKVMMNRFVELIEAYEKLYEASNQVMQIAQPIVGSKKGGTTAANEAFSQLKTTLTQQASKEINSVKLAITPNFLPHIISLDEKIAKLQEGLKTTMKKALDPANTEDLTEQLKKSKGSFEKLASKVDSLKEQNTALSIELDNHVEQSRKHEGSILIKRAECQWALKRIEITTTTLTDLNNLAVKLAGVSSDLERIKVQLREKPFTQSDIAKITIHRLLEINPKMTLEEAKYQIQAFLKECGEIPAKKTFEDALQRKGDQADPNTLSLKSSLEDAKGLFNTIFSSLPRTTSEEVSDAYKKCSFKYNKHLASAQGLKEKAESQIKELAALIENKEEALFKAINGLPFHESAVEKEVKSALDSSFKTMQQERETLRYSLNQMWEGIKGQLQKDQKDFLFYEVNRLGYSIFEYNGKIPYDTSYNVYMVGWQVLKKYVEPLV